MNPKLINSVSLAYIGDAVYELFIREYLITHGKIQSGELHKRAIQFVTAKAQARIVQQWLSDGTLTEGEERVVKRGRNAKSGAAPKHTSIQAYRYSTGFESLLGYLHILEEHDRAEELMKKAIQYIEGEM